MQRTAVILIAVAALLVVLALTLATTVLRRRFGGPTPGPAPNPLIDRRATPAPYGRGRRRDPW